jgi:uncharacterized membrane protein
MRFAGHPVHPMLVHFPIVFWTCAVGADVGGLLSNALPFSDLAFGALALGCLGGLLALITGVLDFADLPKDSPGRDTAVSHLITMCSAWLLFLVALAMRGYPPQSPTPLAAVVITAAGFAVMVVGAWMGGRLVYEHGIGQKAR